MRTVTALRAERRDRVRVELDGEPWRTFPAAAVAAAGLRVGVPLDRERARALGRGRRRSEALDTAGRALSRRDRSLAELEAQLELRGVRPAERAEAVETMERLGYLDEQRMAVNRARELAGRGFGDEAIRYDLEQRGVDSQAIEAAVGRLAPETERIEAVVGARAVDAKLLRALAAKGFSIEAIEAAVPAWDEGVPRHGLDRG